MSFNTFYKGLGNLTQKAMLGSIISRGYQAFITNKIIYYEVYDSILPRILTKPSQEAKVTNYFYDEIRKVENKNYILIIFSYSDLIEHDIYYPKPLLDGLAFLGGIFTIVKVLSKLIIDYINRRRFERKVQRYLRKNREELEMTPLTFN